MALVAAGRGVVASVRGHHGEYLFRFRDLVVLRMAAALRQSDISAERIKEALLTPKASPQTQRPHRCAPKAIIVARATGREWQASGGRRLAHDVHGLNWRRTHNL